MSANELEVISNFLNQANCPEDVFGQLAISNKEEGLKHSFRKLAKAIHPDSYNGDVQARTLAETQFKLLEKMKEEAQEAIKKGVYGKHERFSWKVPILVKGKYVIESSFSAGHICDLYISSIESSTRRSTSLLKIARSQNDNDLLSAEKNVLEKIRAKMKDHKAKDWPNTIPEITESFLLDDGSTKRRVNVMEVFDGFYTAGEIRKRIPKGVDGRTIGWMWKRLLVLLEWTNKAGFIHGAVLPPHILYFPDNDGNTHKDIRKHSVRLVDWCYAVDYKTRTRLSAWVPEYKNFYAPEIIEKKKLGGYTDLYMGAMTMLYLLGVNISKLMANMKSTIDVDAPESVVRSLFDCIAAKPEKRPQSIGKYFEEFTAILRKEYGVPKYHDFNLPAR